MAPGFHSLRAVQGGCVRGARCRARRYACDNHQGRQGPSLVKLVLQKGRPCTRKPTTLLNHYMLG